MYIFIYNTGGIKRKAEGIYFKLEEIYASDEKYMVGKMLLLQTLYTHNLNSGKERVFKISWLVG